MIDFEAIQARHSVRKYIAKFSIWLAFLLICVPLSATEYVGTMSLASGYTLDDVRVSIDEQGNMTLYRVKFARMMPVRVDVLIPHVKRDNERISGEDIIPSVSGKQHPDRIVTHLQGTADKQILDFRCLMGGKEMHYKGKACK